MLVFNMFTQVFPAVKMRLKGYRRFGESGGLAGQGLDSLRDKEFHCLGAASMLCWPPEICVAMSLDFIVAFQTISDYLTISVTAWA